MTKAATLRKPSLNTEAALSFASGNTSGRGKAIKVQAQAVSGLVPDGDVRLTANIRRDLHLKLKLKAAHERTTIGEIIESLIEQHL